MVITGLSLFSGCGMLDIAVEIGLRYLGLDYEPVGYVERDAYAAGILLARMGESALGTTPVWCGDICDLDARPLFGQVDLVTASPPCQPYSAAGKREGNTDQRSFGAGDGPLPHTLRIIGECMPAMVFFENVPLWVTGGHFRAFGEELCRLGYSLADPFFATAEAVGASHKRERVFVLAYRESGFRELAIAIGKGTGGESREAGWGNRDKVLRQGNGTVGASRSDATGGNVADPERTEGRQRDAGRRSPRGVAAKRTSGELGDTQCGRPSSGAIDGAKAKEPRARHNELGDTQRNGRRQDAPCETRRRQDNDEPSTPIFAPGPGDFDGWNRVIRDGEFDFRAPATKPGVRVLADGVALVVDTSRPDQLRCGGNGVVPLCAAYAFVEIIRSLM